MSLNKGESARRAEAPRVADPNFPIPVDLHRDVKPKSVLAFLAMLASADDAGYCENIHFACSMAGLSLDEMREAFQELELASFIEVLQVPIEIARIGNGAVMDYRTDAQLLGIPLKKTFERMDPASWKKIRARVFERDDWECVYCGSSEDLVCDHLWPISRGGTNEIGNLVTACSDCNADKRAKTLDEWRGRRLDTKQTSA